MYLVLEKDITHYRVYNFTGLNFIFSSLYCTTAMNVHLVMRVQGMRPFSPYIRDGYPIPQTTLLPHL